MPSFAQLSAQDRWALDDKAREWLPPGWHRPNKDGKPVSACKDRWIEIKNAKGDVCYAQWEDVGPNGDDSPGYVFGDNKPGNVAAISLSPAAAVQRET